ncbi:SprT family zinc-dependent metalloprotease [Ferrovibrio sp.]|uniref:M48 family metallopeptidase n=1 Tax=Ferrovibrio sp. TaxID=1917215 RepID=UPI0025C70E03|nr:SprT family zinc-dependent metalloprotease [Ferrovibrio sp.]MBX3455143.1 M48 family metallopeptidase [Ferrovibrio sp.]
MTKGYSHTIELTADGIRLDGETYPFMLRRDARARRMLLRVMPSDGAVVLVLPRNASRRAGEVFLAEQAGWIAARQAERQALRVGLPAWADGGSLPYLGERLPIRHRPEARGRGAVWLEDGAVHVSGEAAHLQRRLRDWLIRQARQRVADEVQDATLRAGVRAARISLRDTTSRWGSCSSTGTLSFSWRLIMAPPPVLRYLVAHEVAHLRHMDHGAGFWGLVASLLGGEADMRAAKAWLRRHGAALHLEG